MVNPSESTELVRRYERWRSIYAAAGKHPRDEPRISEGRLLLSEGFPHPGWTALVLDDFTGGYTLFEVTTEHRTEPHESFAASFSNIIDAGKFVIWKVGVYLRIDLDLPSITQQWTAEWLDPRVRQISLAKFESKFELKDDPTRSFVLPAGGVQPENHLLPLSYDELDTLLLDGMPEAVKSCQ